MKRSPTILVHVVLTTTGITPQEREATLANIGQNAPQSELYVKEPTVKQAVIDLGKAGVAYATVKKSVDANAGLLDAQKHAMEAARAALARALILLRGLAENVATTNTDAATLGFTVYQPVSKGDPIAVPEGILFTPGKQHGTFTVEALDARKRKHFAAQLSLDPSGDVWADLPGHGKRRRLAGYVTGTTVRVRFAALRGQQTGSWGPANAIVVP